MKLKNDSTDLELFDYVNELRKQGMFLFVEDKKLKYRNACKIILIVV